MKLNTIINTLILSEEIKADFWKKVNKNSGIFGEDGNYPTECWIWLGSINPKSKYAYVVINKKCFLVHLISFYIEYGYVDPSLVRDHLCRIRHCVRPDHLEEVSNQVNCERGKTGLYNKCKTHCKNGHEYNVNNTLTYKGERKCKLCNRENQRKREGYTKTWNGFKTHCKRGHEFNKENTLPIKHRSGKIYRRCKQCKRDQDQNS